MSAESSRTSRYSTNPSAPTPPSRATTLPTTTSATAMSAPPGRTSGYGKKSTECRVRSSISAYRASKLDCEGCSLKPRCCPNAPARKIPRSIHEGARDMARDIAKTEAYLTSRCERKKVEMLFAHLKRILKLDRLRLRGPNGARDEFHLAATAQNLRKLAMLIPAPAPIAAT